MIKWCNFHTVKIMTNKTQINRVFYLKNKNKFIHLFFLSKYLGIYFLSEIKVLFIYHCAIIQIRISVDAAGVLELRYPPNPVNIF
jgi:hypothetical protein